MWRSRTLSERRTLARYLLLQLPGWVLVALILWAMEVWTKIPTWALASAMVAFIVKDLAIYPWVRPAYEKTVDDPAEHLVGQRGVTVEPIDPQGWVRVRAELWRAESAASSPDIPAGATVRVCGLRDHTLLIQPDD